MIQRIGEVVIRMLAHVKQRTIGPLTRRTIAPGSLVYLVFDVYDAEGGFTTPDSTTFYRKLPPQAATT